MSTVDPLPRAEQRRVELLDRLARLFLAEGFLGFGVGDLAARLRCSRSSLYLVAASKPEIVLATLRDWFRGAAQRIEERVLAEPDPAARLRTYLLAVSDELAPASPQFYADLVAHPPAGEVYEENTGTPPGGCAPWSTRGSRRGPCARSTRSSSAPRSRR